MTPGEGFGSPWLTDSVCAADYSDHDHQDITQRHSRCRGVSGARGAGGEGGVYDKGDLCGALMCRECNNSAVAHDVTAF